MCAATAPPPPPPATSGPGGHGLFPVPPASCMAPSNVSGGPDLPPAPQSDCRGRYQLLLSGKALAERYRQIYTAAVSDRDQQAGQTAR